MLRFLISVIVLLVWGYHSSLMAQPESSAKSESENSASAPPVAIVIHGGAGTILRSKMTPELEKSYHQVLQQALNQGYKILQQGGSSIDAVTAAVVLMEDSPLFNAGKGAVFTHDKTNELDASIMDGQSLNAGAVAGVTNVKNPIKLALTIMNQSDHVMLSGGGAEAFAEEKGLDLVAPSYFYTERRWQQLMKKLKKQKPSKDKKVTEGSLLLEDRLSQEDKFSREGQVSQVPYSWPDDDKFGTVGAVALDVHGNLAAATSTGGMTNKKYGRIGDSPVIGAGTYADNQACAISATGHGEYFIRAAVAHDICSRSLYQGILLQQAADQVIKEKLVKMGGQGGIIGLDPKGVPVFSFNSKGMYRGYIDVQGRMLTEIYE